MTFTETFVPALESEFFYHVIADLRRLKMEANVKKVIMVADADPFVRELVGRYISDAGYEVIYAVDGYDALDNARKSPPTAILADIFLPRLDGLRLCRLLKADASTEHVTTVIVFSVLSAEERAKAAGADAFVKKPLEKSRLLKTLEKAISKEPVHD